MNEDNFEITTGYNNFGSLILLISKNQNANSFKKNLISLGYQVSGPLPSVDHGYRAIRQFTPSIIIFDLDYSLNENEDFQGLLNHDAKEIPIIVLSNFNRTDFTHKRIKILNPTTNSLRLKEEIESMIDDRELRKKETSKLNSLNFTNLLFPRIIVFLPEKQKEEDSKIVNQSLVNMISRIASLTINEYNQIDIINNAIFDEIEFLQVLNITIEDIIYELDQKNNSNTAKSLICEAIESVLIGWGEISSSLLDFINKFSSDLIKKVAIADKLIETESYEKKCDFVGLIELTDQGPVLSRIRSIDNSVKDKLDSKIVSTLMIVVGQGTSYHEGIYGPIPISLDDEEYVTIIWSKVLKSDILDDRMNGNSLGLVVVGCKRRLINFLPKKTHLINIFDTLKKSIHMDHITDESLEIIYQKFNEYLS